LDEELAQTFIIAEFTVPLPCLTELRVS
jgi:hypothetical protein